MIIHGIVSSVCHFKYVQQTQEVNRNTGPNANKKISIQTILIESHLMH